MVSIFSVHSCFSNLMPFKNNVPKISICNDNGQLSLGWYYEKNIFALTSIKQKWVSRVPTEPPMHMNQKPSASPAIFVDANINSSKICKLKTWPKIEWYTYSTITYPQKTYIPRNNNKYLGLVWDLYSFLNRLIQKKKKRSNKDGTKIEAKFETTIWSIFANFSNPMVHSFFTNFSLSMMN